MVYFFLCLFILCIISFDKVRVVLDPLCNLITLKGLIVPGLFNVQVLHRSRENIDVGHDQVALLQGSSWAVFYRDGVEDLNREKFAGVLLYPN